MLCEDDNLGNLHVALAAQEINSQLRVVIRMFNPELGSRAERLLTNCRVLSSSAIAAPMFASAAEGDDASGHLIAWGKRLLVHDQPADGDPIVHLDEGEHHHHVHDGGSAVIELARRRLGSIGRELRAMTALADRRLAGVLAVIAILAFIAIAVFHLFYGLSWVDALYFTATTISTVGYGDINLLGAAPWLKVFGVGVMLLGAAALAAFYALITDAVVGARLALAMGVPHGRIKGHYIVCGLGNVGYRVVECLAGAGHRVAAAELKEHSRFVGLARQHGVPVLIGGARLTENLRLLSADKAAALVAATDDDIANLEMAPAARDLNPGLHVVVRVFDPELAERARRTLGLHATYSASALAAPVFAAAALEDGCLGTLGKKRRWLLGELEVAVNSKMEGRLVAEITKTGEVAVIAARQDGTEQWRPDDNVKVAAGHSLLLFAPQDEFRRLRAEATARPARRRSRKVTRGPDGARHSEQEPASPPAIGSSG